MVSWSPEQPINEEADGTPEYTIMNPEPGEELVPTQGGQVDTDLGTAEDQSEFGTELSPAQSSLQCGHYPFIARKLRRSKFKHKRDHLKGCKGKKAELGSV